MNSLRLFFTEDQDIVRKGISGFIEKVANMDVVGSASDASTAVRMAREFQPDVMILDVALPQSDGIQSDEQTHANVRNETFRALCGMLGLMMKMTKVERIKVTLYRNRMPKRFSPENDEDPMLSGGTVTDFRTGSEFGIFNMLESNP
jgi:CheY-like chemotaxis protein